MSLRALGSILLTGSRSSARRRARSDDLHTLKHIAGHGDSRTVGVLAAGGSALAGLVGMLYFKKRDADRSPARQLASEIADKRKETEEEDKEAAMEARFEDWMKEHGRTYISDKEKARRYQIFKANAVDADRSDAAPDKPHGAHYAMGNNADWTDEECHYLQGGGGGIIESTISPELERKAYIFLREMHEKEAAMTNNEEGRSQRVAMGSKASNPEPQFAGGQELAAGAAMRVEHVDSEEPPDWGFSLYMKQGGCKEAFMAWDRSCLTSVDEEELIYLATINLKKCMEAHAEYYGPALQMLREMFDYVEAAMAAAEANKSEVPFKATDEEKKVAPVFVAADGQS